VDRGSTFVVALPLAVAHLPAQRAARAHAAPAGAGVADFRLADLAGVSVLVVDDEPDARELLTEVLQDYGAESAAAGSAEEALGLLASFRPNVLVSDIGLPGEDGYALIERIRALPADQGGAIPALALTAYARSEDAHRALACGFHQHAVKPIAPADLARLVRSLLSPNGDAGQVTTTDSRGRSEGGKDDTSSSTHPAV
jgi:CheY-like chemotaxis protein